MLVFSGKISVSGKNTINLRPTWMKLNWNNSVFVRYKSVVRYVCHINCGLFVRLPWIERSFRSSLRESQVSFSVRRFASLSAHFPKLKDNNNEDSIKQKCSTLNCSWLLLLRSKAFRRELDILQQIFSKCFAKHMKIDNDSRLQHPFRNARGEQVLNAEVP